MMSNTLQQEPTARQRPSPATSGNQHQQHRTTKSPAPVGTASGWSRPAPGSPVAKAFVNDFSAAGAAGMDGHPERKNSGKSLRYTKFSPPGCCDKPFAEL